MNVVSRYMQQPHDIHWKEAKRILQYISGTRTYDIHYAADSELELVGYTDSDCMSDSIDQKSTSRLQVAHLLLFQSSKLLSTMHLK